MILAGDIGGTKTYLGLFNVKDGRPELTGFGAFKNAEFGGYLEIIERFLEKEGRLADIEAAAFGVAGTIEGGRCSMTNIRWVIDAAEISANFRIRKAGLLNDLAAAAWGVDLLSANDLFTLQKGNAGPGNAAVIAAGTGLGESLLYWDGASHIPLPSEAGHADFAPRTRIETELLEYLSGVYGHVSYERALSGQGIENIHAFFKDRSGSQRHGTPLKRPPIEGAAAITEEAMNGTDEPCRNALELFISLYGAESGNLALRALASGGVYVGGGIAIKILPALKKDGSFVDSFCGKGRLRGFLSRVPVHVILNDKIGLLGAGRYAARMP